MFLRGAVDLRQWLQSPSKLENYVRSLLYNLCKKNSKIIKSGKENPLQKRIPTKLELNRLDSKKQNCCASGGPLCISNQSPSRYHYTNEFRPCLDHEITCGKIKDITITSHNRLTIYIYEYIHTTWGKKKLRRISFSHLCKCRSTKITNRNFVGQSLPQIRLLNWKMQNCFKVYFNSNLFRYPSNFLSIISLLSIALVYQSVNMLLLPT